MLVFFLRAVELAVLVVAVAELNVVELVLCVPRDYHPLECLWFVMKRQTGFQREVVKVYSRYKQEV